MAVEMPSAITADGEGPGMPEWEDERDRLEAEVNRWHAEAVSAQADLDLQAREFKQRESMWIKKIQEWEALAREKNWGYVHDDRIDRLTAALQQIAWLADATEPLSVKAAEIARMALDAETAPRPPLCGYCGDRLSSLVPCPECDS